MKPIVKIEHINEGEVPADLGRKPHFYARSARAALVM
jgi:hypothetical protein